MSMDQKRTTTTRPTTPTTAPVSPGKGKGKKVTIVPETHPHTCLGGGKHSWEHSDDEPCTRMNTKLCPTHAEEMRAQLNQEPEPAGQPMGQVLGLKPEAKLTPAEQAAYQRSLKGGDPFEEELDAELDDAPAPTPAQSKAAPLAKAALAITTAQAKTETPVATVTPAPTATPPKAAKPAPAPKAEKPAVVLPAVPPVLPAPDDCLTPGCPRLDDLRGLCAKCYTHAGALIGQGLTSWATLEAAGKAKPKAAQGPSDLPHRRAWFLGEWAPAEPKGLTMAQVEALPRGKPAKARKTA